MAKRLVVALVLISAGAAQAQPNTVTCRNNGYGVVTCNQSFPSAPPPSQGNYSQGSGVAASLLAGYLLSRRERSEKQDTAKSEERAIVVQNSVAYYVGEGKCDRALQVAVENARGDLAEQVRTGCVSR